MRFDVVLLIFIGYFIKVSHSGGHGGKHVHVKIYVPVYKHTHKHTNTIYKKPREEKKIIIHKHRHEHGHGHEHDHNHKHGHKHNHGHKHKHDHHHKHKGGHHYGYHHGHHDYGHDHHSDWGKNGEVETFNNGGGFRPSPQIDSYGIIPTFNHVESEPELHSFDDDGYHNSHKSARSETFEITEKKNSAAADPIGKHYVTGSYKVEETDPHDFTNTQYHKIFQAPLANINVHETNYEPTGFSDDDVSEYGDAEEEYPEGVERDAAEDDDYSKKGAYGQNSGAGSYETAYEIEALKQFFNI